MAFSIPSFGQIRNTIIQEVSNLTGLSLNDDSDAAIRADGTAAVVEGLYAHQAWIAKQLFIATADEAGLLLHSERLNCPRLGGSLATGEILAISNSNVVIPQGSKLTDGTGLFIRTINDVSLNAGAKQLIDVQATNVGASYNMDGTLSWVSPIAGVSTSVDIVTLSGGSDGESLESFRSRLLTTQQLGTPQGREEDYKLAARSVAGIKDVYVFARRRGLGSTDICITAKGANSTGALPSNTMLAAVQDAVYKVVVANEDVHAFAPTRVAIDVTATLTGRGIDANIAKSVLKAYMDGLAPADTYRESVLTDRLMALSGVTDVSLSQNSNIIPKVNWMVVEWLQAGNLSVVLK